MTIQLVTLSNFEKSEKQNLLRQAECIFFQTAITKDFASTEDRDLFRKRWFGRYAGTYPSEFFLALSSERLVIGYLAGCLDTFATMSTELVKDISYYTPSLIEALGRYPSHLHINIKPSQQKQGIGRALIGRFVESCRLAGSSGVHVVTGATSPAVAFYTACGFGFNTPRHGVSEYLTVLTLTVRA